MIATSARIETEYILKEERGTESPTVFRLRPLTRRERDELGDMLGLQLDKTTYPGGSFTTKLVRGGLVGWRDFRDAAGADVPFATTPDGKPTDETLERIPMDAYVELANEIFRQSNLSAGERKN